MMHPTNARTSLPRVPGGGEGLAGHEPHRRNISVASGATGQLHSSPFGHPLPQPPPATPNLHGDRHTPDMNSVVNGSSRSTSAYSNIPYNALPLPASMFAGGGANRPPAYPASEAEALILCSQAKFPPPPGLRSFHVDVLRSHRAGLLEKDGSQGADHSSGDMPPPPLPSHGANVNAKADSNALRHAIAGTQTDHDPALVNTSGRRGASRSDNSDVSMHANCANISDCIHEDESRCVVRGPVTPATIMRGKKEGLVDSNSKSICPCMRIPFLLIRPFKPATYVPRPSRRTRPARSPPVQQAVPVRSVPVLRSRICRSMTKAHQTWARRRPISPYGSCASGSWLDPMIRRLLSRA